MKVKSALAQSKSHAKFLAVVLPVVGAVVAFFPGTIGFICVGVLAFSLAMEVINIVCITRRSRTNPDYLEEKIK